MFNLKSKVCGVARVLGAALIASAIAGLAHASAPTLKATQDMFVHSYDGMGCEDASSTPNEGRMRPGSCVEFQIKIQNNDKQSSAKAINFKNPVDTGLVFIMAVTDGFATGTLDIPKMNTDCGTQTCIVSIQNASLKPRQTGVLKIRAIVK